MEDPDRPDDRDARSSRWISFSEPGFARFWSAHLATGMAVQILTVAVGWQVYDLTRNPFDLGLVGLSQFAPALLLVVVTGAASDRFPRRIIMSLSLLALGLCATALLVFTLAGGTDARVIFAVLVGLGTARAFYNPARQSIVPNLVPPERLANAIALTSTANQFAMIAGPAAGGLLYGLAPGTAYGAALSLLVSASILALLIPKPPQKSADQTVSLGTLLAGFRYVWNDKVVLGAISLDMFTVLLGGAVALLPVYARDVLDVGPWGLGFLRSAPAVGAILLAYWLISNPIRRHAGRIMLGAAFGFGVCIVVFGASETLWVSVLALAVMGGCDMVSIYVRNTLIQIWTPDELRGRVNAVNQVFIGASNELGGFRAGTTAALIGAVPAVVLGGFGTMAVAVLWHRLFPGLREVQRLDRRV